MRYLRRCVVLWVLAVCYGSPAYGENQGVSREQAIQQQIKRQMIEESIASYPGSCPCPYNTMRNGRACGGRSAWSKKGGHAPICYDTDVTRDALRARMEVERQQSGLWRPAMSAR